MTTLTLPSTPPAPGPALVPRPAPWRNFILRQFSVSEYHRMIENGIFADDERVELLEGYLVLKMGHNPPHDGTVLRATKRLGRLLPAGWDIRGQSAITLADSEPEPDLAVVREDPADYSDRHPSPADIGLVVEVAESSLAKDRDEKARIYAAAGIPVYWIINLIDRQIEVHTEPSGPTAAPAYAKKQIIGANDSVPLTLDGAAVGSIPAAELLP